METFLLTLSVGGIGPLRAWLARREVVSRRPRRIRVIQKQRQPYFTHVHETDIEIYDSKHRGRSAFISAGRPRKSILATILIEFHSISLENSTKLQITRTQDIGGENFERNTFIHTAIYNRFQETVK